MQVVVIGAGLSGLATAWYLTERGVSVRVVESAAAPGGLMQTHHVADGMVETAARAFTSSPRVLALFRALDITPIEPLKASRRRYVFRDGRPRRWPLTVSETAASLAYGARAFATRATEPREHETAFEWGRRVAGPAATEWLLAPALQGVYASPLDQLSANALFGLAPRIRGPIIAPRGGVGDLITRLRAKLAERGAEFAFGTAAEALDPSVVTAVCTSAPSAAQLLRAAAPSVAAAIGRIRMVKLMPVTVFYEARPDDVRGFGILFPRRSGVRALGVLFNTDMFEGRGTMRSETWIYGDVDEANLPSGLSLADALQTDRAVLSRRRDDPISAHPLTSPARLPVYDQSVIDAHASLPALPPHIGITGNYLGRIGVSGILESAAETAARLAPLAARQR